MKVIFLDIDGVLNWAGTEDRYLGFIGLCKDRIQRFNKIIEAHPDAKIVISSTWRIPSPQGRKGYRTFEGLIRLLRSRGLRGRIIGSTPKRFSYNPRGNEIREWIEDWREQNPGQELNYVILDDDTSAMAGYSWEARDEDGDDYVTHTAEDLVPRHVVTTFYGEQMVVPQNYGNEIITEEEGGLQDRHVEAAIRVLNGEVLKS